MPMFFSKYLVVFHQSRERQYWEVSVVCGDGSPESSSGLRRWCVTVWRYVGGGGGDIIEHVYLKVSYSKIKVLTMVLSMYTA